MTVIICWPNGDFEKTLKIFNRRVQKSGVLVAYKDHLAYHKPSEKMKIKRHRAGVRRKLAKKRFEQRQEVRIRERRSARNDQM